MILFIATAWNASQGGINAFNIELARATARAGHAVACAVTSVDDTARKDAAADDILLIEVAADEDGRPAIDCWTTIARCLSEQGQARQVALWVGHDLISGEAAARAADQTGGELALVHHMDYAAYQNFGGTRGNDAVANHKRQIALFSHPSAHIFGLGSYLQTNAGVLAGRGAHILVPGLPAAKPLEMRLGMNDFRVLAAGRFDAQTEPLKRIGTAVKGFAKAVARGHKLMSRLSAPGMTILGVDDDQARTAMSDEAAKLAGIPVHLMPAAFDEDPNVVAILAARSHLVIVPSRHEGFSLVGWEAIGSATPLIIGRGAGLTHLLEAVLKGEAEGLLQVLPLNGSEADEELIAEAILRVADNPTQWFERARRLRDRLQAELGCSWEEAAVQLLAPTGLGRQAQAPVARRSRPIADTSSFLDTGEDYFPRCAEMRLSAAQGSSRQTLELIAELRFGITPLAVHGIKADIGIRRAILQVKPRGARIARAERLGEGSRQVAGIEARAGGVWIVTSTESGILLGRSLGTESLCLVEHGAVAPLAVDVEVTATKEDVICTITKQKGRLSVAKQKVMAVFLKEALWNEENEHLILCQGQLRETNDAD